MNRLSGKKGLLQVVAVAAGAIFAAAAFAIPINNDYIPITTSTGPIVPGEWNASITAGKEYADENHVPMLAIYGTAFCGNCHQLQTACNSDEFVDWAERKKIVMVFNTDTATKNFCQEPGNTALPFVCVYWLKDDGSLIQEKFTGRLGSMPSDDGDTIESQLINSCDLYIGQYPQLSGFEYLAFTNNYEMARLEAEVGRTAYVDVPLYRDSFMRGYVSTNTFKAVCNGIAIVDKTVVWDASSLEMSVRVDIPPAAVPGDEIEVTLMSSNGDETGSVTIFVVAERENSPKNPLFVGERTKDTLQYGEWTMDLDVAMDKYRSVADSKLLALVGGSLWCPDCVMTDLYLLDRPEFKAWAEANKVILVDIDIPNLPNTTNSPSLLTRIAVRTSDGYITARGTKEPDEAERYQSGAGYLSRHMVSEDEAAAVFARNCALVGTNRADGGWNDPDRANQSRTGVPVFFAINRDGTVAGCLDTFSNTAPKEYKEAYLLRFDELLALAEVGADMSGNSWKTTKLPFSGAGSSSVTGSLRAIDLVDTFILDPVVSEAATQTITVTGSDEGVAATVSLIVVSDGVAMTAATAKGPLADGVTVETTLTPRDVCYVQIVGSAEGRLSIDSAAASTEVSYAISGRREAVANPFSNDWTNKKVFATLPMFGGDGNEVAGRLDLNLKRKGKLAAKLYSDAGSVAVFRGEWDGDISADGTAWAELHKGNYMLTVRISATGVVKAWVEGGSSVLQSGACALSEDGYGAFAGNYTVALPLESFGDVAPVSAGDAYMTLSIPGGAAALKGKVKFVVYLPNGKKLKGKSGVVGYDANFGVVSVAKSSPAAGKFTAALLVRRESGSAPTHRAVMSMGGVKAIWADAGAQCECGVYGSYVVPSDSLAEVSGTDKLVFRAHTGSLYSLNTYNGMFKGAVYDGGVMNVTADTIAVAEATRGFSFKLNRKTGVFKGKTSLSFTGKEKVSAKFSGVILPHWFSDCECQEDDDNVVPMVFMPFGDGQCIFSDRVDGKRVKRSFPVELGATGD